MDTNNFEVVNLWGSELIEINGGSEYSENFVYVLAQICKGIYYYSKAASEGGYVNGKC